MVERSYCAQDGQMNGWGVYRFVPGQALKELQPLPKLFLPEDFMRGLQKCVENRIKKLGFFGS